MGRPGPCEARAGGRRDPADPAGVGARHVRLRDDPFRQSQPGARLGPADGSRRPRDPPVLGEHARRRSPLRRLRDPLRPRAVGAVAAPLAEDAVRRSGPAGAGLLDPLPARRPRAADARRRHVLRVRCRLLHPGALRLFRGQPAARRRSARGPADRLDPRHDRVAVLATPQALVRALAADPLCLCAAAADAGDPRLHPGRPPDHGDGRKFRLARRHGADLSTPGTGGCGVPRIVGGVGAVGLPGGARRGARRAARAPVVGAAARHHPPDLSERPRGADDTRHAGAGGEPDGRHSPCLGVRRPRTLLHLPHQGRGT